MEIQFKPLFKGELAAVYELHRNSLPIRFEAMEEDGKISSAWRRVRKLNSAMVAAFVAYYGKPDEKYMKLITVKT